MENGWDCTLWIMPSAILYIVANLRKKSTDPPDIIPNLHNFFAYPHTDSQTPPLWREGLSTAGASDLTIQFSGKKCKPQLIRNILSGGQNVRNISTMSMAMIIGIIRLAMDRMGTLEIAVAMNRLHP